MNGWLLAHVAATWAMVGFIWTVQLLVYPQMAVVPAAGFARYEQLHQRRVVAAMAPFAFAEVIAAGALALVDTGVPSWQWLAGGVLLTALWVGTGAFYAPLHGRLAEGFDPTLHARLVRTNWLRTVGWTLRGALALAMLASVS